MITTTDAANILYKDCAIFGMPVYHADNAPTGLIGDDGRVVIHIKAQSPESIWKKGFMEVNIFVADTKQGHEDLIRINELERLAIKSLNATGKYDGTVYRYSVASTVPLKNETLKAHYVNVKILFKVMNTME